MNENLNEAIHLRRLENDLDELAGRATPPDRTAEILRRASLAHRRWPFARRHLVAAALMLLGIGVTVAVALSRPNEPTRDAGQPGPLSNAPMAAAPAAAPSPQVPLPGRPVSTSGKPPAKATEAPAHPKGTDPADLAAARSAEAMLVAERRLAAMFAEGKFPGHQEPLRFETLRDWVYQDGLTGLPPAVQALDNTHVVMVGFMLPIDEVQNIREFLLVESLWSCCYGTPPDIHGIVRCVMPANQTTDYSFEPLLISGTLTVSATMEAGYCVDIFQLHIDSVVPLN